MKPTGINPSSLSRIPPPFRGPMEDYVQMLQRLAGDAGPVLLGLTVYGAALTPEFEIARMGVPSVLLMEKADPGLLRRLAEKSPAYVGRGIELPLIMTPAFIRDSQDTFPLELLEISQNRATVFGVDGFEGMEIQPEHLRLQCEREFKRILIRCRQSVLAAGGHEEALGEMEADIGLHLLRTLRGKLWLMGRREFITREQVIGQIEQKTGEQYAGIRNVILHVRGLGWPEFQAFYADVERLAERTDAL